METRIPLPEPDRWDFTHTTAKAALSALPVVGGPAAEFFNSILAPPLSKRRDQWFQKLAQDVDALSKTVDEFQPERLAENEAFVSALLVASRMAVTTHKTEKIEALRNAVLNIALGKEPDENLQEMFLGYVDRLTEWHLRVLRFFESPTAFVGPNTLGSGALSHVLERTFPELRGRREFYDQVARDLHSLGFLNSAADVLHVMMSDHGLQAKRTTATGERFLNFIRSPLGP